MVSEDQKGCDTLSYLLKCRMHVDLGLKLCKGAEIAVFLSQNNGLYVKNLMVRPAICPTEQMTPV